MSQLQSPTPPARLRGAWISIGDLALECGVTHVAISKRVSRYAELGLLHPRKQGRQKLVNVEQWRRVTSENDDPVRLAARDLDREASGLPPARDMSRPEAPALAPASSQPPADPDAPNYNSERAQKARLDRLIQEQAYKKSLGQLLEIDAVVAAMTACAESLVREIDELPSLADDLASAVKQGGVPALRETLKAKARDLRATLAANMQILAGATDD